MKEEVIQFVGLKDLNAEEQNTVNTLCTKYFPKIKRDLNNLTSFIVHVKCYKIEGKRKKYSLHLRCTAPGKTYESDKKAHGWDLAEVIHKGFKSLEKQITHKLHNDSSWKKSYE